MKKRKSNFIGAVIEFGTEPLFLTLTTIVTVIFGILVNLFDPESTLYRICDRGFFISLSLILVQVMLQQTEIKQESAAIYTKISAQDNVIFSDEKAKINEMFDLNIEVNYREDFQQVNDGIISETAGLDTIGGGGNE